MNLTQIDQILTRAIAEMADRELRKVGPSPLSEARIFLTKKEIEKLRKDFLTLMKNLKKVNDYEKGERLRKAFDKWHKHFRTTIAQITPYIKELKRGVMADQLYISQEELEHFENNQKPIWDFDWELRDFPMPLLRPGIDKYDRGVTKESAWQQYRRDVDKWEQRARKRSRDAWKWLKNFVAWTELNIVRGRNTELMPVQRPTNENVAMHGFDVQIRGFEPKEFDIKAVDKLKKGLAIYKKRAQRVFPWLIKYKIPIVLELSEHVKRTGSGSAAATYNQFKRRITVHHWISAETPTETARIIAHEMGHHIYKQVLSKEATDKWESLVKGSETKLDLRELLKKRANFKSEREWEKHVKKNDPILALQLDTLDFHPTYSKHDLWTIEGIKEYIERYGPFVNVPQYPITGYGATKPEEGFCEALGNLVGHGPQTLHKQVRIWLKKFVPAAKHEEKEQ